MSPAVATKPVNAMSIDVEDYFQVSAFEGHIDRADWNDFPCRVEMNTRRAMELFADASVKATFFMLGWVAERYPKLVKDIVAEGHELASHGYQHTRVTQQTPDMFREDVIKTKSLLEDISGVAIRGYRAASFSIGRDNLWALDVLGETGHEYSSSIYPIHHDLYGIPEAPRFAFYPRDNGLLEIPVTTIQLGEKKLPCGGGGYFRLLPYQVSRWAMRRVNNRDQQACIFYFHPWELDPEQPRQQGVGLKTRFRHYLNLGRMQNRLQHLLADFSWDRIDRVFLDGAQGKGV